MNHPKNHPYREPGTEHHTGRLIRDQEAHATTRITRGLDAARTADTPIDASTARLIAATLHPGYGSHLEHFASTGQLNPAGALAEINDSSSGELHQIPWALAVARFLEQIDTPDLDRPEIDHTESAPLIYVQAYDPILGLRPLGGWLDPRIPTVDLASQIDAIRELAGVDDTRTRITATVGFHQLSVPDDAAPEQITVLAGGIARHGEAYATYTRHLGHPVTEEQFENRFLGTIRSFEDYFAALPDQDLNLVRTLSTPDGQDTAFDRYEASIRHTHLCLDGRHGIHLFRSPPTPDTSKGDTHA